MENQEKWWNDSSVAREAAFAPPPEEWLGPVRIVSTDSANGGLRVMDVAPGEGDFLEAVAGLIVAAVAGDGGRVPVTAVRELVTNFLHARFADACVMVLEGGNKVVFSDHGPGIADPARALTAGYTTAGAEMRRYLRGTGCGLPLVQAAVQRLGGVVRVDSNLAGGTVVSVEMPTARAGAGAAASGELARELTDKHKRVLVLLRELGEGGPSTIARELRVGVATAHRALTELEGLGLVASNPRGKRVLTDRGLEQLGVIFAA